MKVAGETFSFASIEKAPKRQDTISIQTFRQKDCCRTGLWKALYEKAPTGQFLLIRKTHTEFTHKETYPNFLGRIFQVKGQGKKVISLFSYPVFLLR